MTSRPDDLDTLPEWLWQRFNTRGGFKTPAAHAAWLVLPSEDREFWAHEAAAVRRAVARDGFKDALPTPTLMP
jgi:hypothetical protein